MTSLPQISVRRQEAAELLRVSVDHVDDLIRDGKLRTSKSGTALLIEYASLIEHFEEGRTA